MRHLRCNHGPNPNGNHNHVLAANSPAEAPGHFCLPLPALYEMGHAVINYHSDRKELSEIISASRRPSCGLHCSSFSRHSARLVADPHNFF